MNDTNQNTIPIVKTNRFFLFAGCSALLSAFILAADLLLSTQITMSEDTLEFWFLASMFVALPAAVALCLVRRPLLLTAVGIASVFSWGIILGSIILSIQNPSLGQELIRFLGYNVLLCIASHLVWTTWSGYLFLSGRLNASS